MSESAMLPPRLLRVASVARELDCSVSKVYALIAKEQENPGTGLPAIRIDPDPAKGFPGMLRVRREDVEALLVRWGIKSTGADDTAASGASSGGMDAASNAMRSASKRQRAIGRMLTAR